MPSLPAFISYRKVKSPFSKRRFGSPSTASFSQASPSPQPLSIAEHGRKKSVDFSDSPTPSFEVPQLLQTHRPPSPRLQLDLDLTSDHEQLSDWFSTSFPRSGPSPKSTTAEEYEDDTDGELLNEEEVFEDSIDRMLSGDVIANLEAMNASSFGRLRPDSIITHTSRLKIPTRDQLFIMPTTDENGAYLTKPSRPMSQISSAPSSAVSGTTLARQLIGNGFSLSHDNRSYRPRPPAGRTRTDSMTLPSNDFEEHFEVDPDAPPVPQNAESLYVPPKLFRDTPAVSPRVSLLKRRSSTGTISPPDSATLPPQRPSSVLISPTDIQTGLPPSPLESSFPPPPPKNDVSELRKNPPPALNIPISLIPGMSARGVTEDDDDTDRLSQNAEDEDVLDYYSFSGAASGTPIPQRGFRPVFTPITEESLSQLSPPAPYSKGDRRDSQRSQPFGARSPGSPSFKARAVHRSASESIASSSLLSIVQEAKGLQTSVSLGSPSPLSRFDDFQTSVDAINDSLLPLLPPPKVFNRKRSGSAPSPIMVFSDTEDLSKYKMTVGSRAIGRSEGTLSAIDSSQEEQEFPETATASWSATFSPGIQEQGGPEGHVPAEVPMSATLPSTNQLHPNIQQILLTRAATSARARHSRQASLHRAGQQPPVAHDPIKEVSEPPRVRNEAPQELDAKGLPPQRPPPQVSLPPSPSVVKYPPSRIPQTQEPIPITQSRSLPTLLPANGSYSFETAGSSSSSASTSTSNIPPRPLPKLLPRIPIPPPPSSPPPSPPPPPVRVGRSRAPPQPLELAQAAVPLPVIAEGPSSPAPIPAPQEAQSAPPPVILPPPPQFEGPPPPPPQSSVSQKSTNTIDELLRASTVLGSPPPYYTVVDQLHAPQQANSAAIQNPDTTFPSAQSPAPTPSATFSNPFGNQTRDSASSSRSRLERLPSAPLGPRRPTLPSQGGTSPFPQIDRIWPAASVARQGSTATTVPNTSRSIPRRSDPVPLASPKFQSPPIKHRGYTMEAAKWTFTSAQLQTIVSRAIRESAHTSSIRLLKLETLDQEIPEEIHGLEMYRSDVKSRYKALTKRRAFLFESLSFHLSGSAAESEAAAASSSVAARVAEELSSIAASLDHLAEDLHSTDLHLSQLKSLLQLHSSSALAMALRKLNASFLNQVAENKSLQERIITLEAERDEAWKQAEEIAKEYDHLNFPPDKPHEEAPSSKRSSRISAKRKSSLRVSKAGLRSVSRGQSARSSIVGTGFPSVTTTPLRMEDIPPLPPIPKRRPAGLSITEYHAPLGSSGALSSDGITPTSETRALVRAEEEVYTMLGLAAPRSSAPRARSMVGLPSAGLSPPPLSARMNAYTRRSSLPGEAKLIEAQNAMVADGNAVVFTFEMLRDSDDLLSPQRYL